MGRPLVRVAAIAAFLVGFALTFSVWAQQPAGTQEPKAGPAGAAPVAQPGTPAPAAGAPGTSVEVQKAPQAAAAEPTTGDEAYAMKITELERRVNELKEKIFQSKVRLNILKESVLSSSIAAAQLQIVHRNEMGSSFRLEKVTYSLDGAVIKNDVDRDGSLDDKEEIEVMAGAIAPGNHNLSVVMIYRGHGYGIFSYLEGYVFKLRSSDTFFVEEGKKTIVKVVGFERGGITTDLQDRPSIRFDKKIIDLASDGGATALNKGR